MARPRKRILIPAAGLFGILVGVIVIYFGLASYLSYQNFLNESSLGGISIGPAVSSSQNLGYALIFFTASAAVALGAVLIIRSMRRKASR